MKLKRAVINHYGKLSNMTLGFRDGINLISGENESGKSTLHSFFSSMIFGLERGRGRAARFDTYTQYRPWDGGTYGGVIEVESGGTTYSVSRNFDKEIRSCIITNETESRDVKDTPENLAEIFCGLSPALYQNTISVGQLSASPGEDLAGELRSHIVNLRTAGSSSIDVSGALDELKVQKRRAMAAFSKEAQAEAGELTLRIQTLEKELAEAPDTVSITRLENDRQALEERLSGMERETARLNERISAGEEVLRRHHIAAPEDVSALLADTDDVADRLSAYIEDDREPMSKGVKFLTVVLLILAVAGLGLCGWQGLQCWLSRTFPAFYYYAGAAGAALLMGILCGAALVRASNYRLSMLNLTDLYEEHVGPMPEEMTEPELRALYESIENYGGLFKKIAASREAIQRNYASMSSLREDLQGLNANLDRARQISWRREQKEEALAGLQNRMEMLRGPLERNAEIEEEAAALDLAAETIRTISSTAFESFGSYLEEAVSRLLSSMTGGAYDGVSIDESLNITLLKDLTPVALSQVSSGTLDQVYLALRLACIGFLWPDTPMPLFLDDAFALYDDVRLASTLRWLSENYTGQVFIFTCQNREGELLRQLGIPFNTAFGDTAPTASTPPTDPSLQVSAM